MITATASSVSSANRIAVAVSEVRQSFASDSIARDPEPRSEAFERQIARNFKEEITEEKDPRAPPKHRRGEAEILVHLQCGKADIDAIQVAEKVAERDERYIRRLTLLITCVSMPASSRSPRRLPTYVPSAILPPVRVKVKSALLARRGLSRLVFLLRV